jgi:hypothetical protein
MSIRRKQVTLGPTDGAGAFSVSVTAPGLVRAVAVDLGTLSTPDLVITDAVTADNILTVAGIAADTRYQPKIVATDPADGSALDSAGDVAYESPACMGTMTIAITGGGAVTTGTLYLLLES